MRQVLGLDVAQEFLPITELVLFLRDCFRGPPVAEIIASLRESGLTEVPYVDEGMDFQLPPFDSCFRFRFVSPGRVPGKLEFLLQGQQLLQVGFQLIYPRHLLFSRFKKDFATALETVKAYYGKGIPIDNPVGKAIMFPPDEVSHCYVGRYKSPGESLVVRVGNKTIWDGHSLNKHPA